MGQDTAGSPAAVVSAWMQSREHRLNMLDPGYALAGVGLARGWADPSGTRDDSMTVALELGWRALPGAEDSVLTGTLARLPRC